MRGYILFGTICCEYVRSYTFRATLSQFCESAIRSNTFLLRSYTFRLTFQRFCYKVIRSYTFRATLPSNCEDVIRSYTFWLRSYTFPHTFRKTLLKVICSYTFRATLQLKCTNVIRSCTFLMRSLLHSGRSYVAAAFRPPSCTLVAIGPLVLQRHLLLRSYTFLIRSVKPFHFGICWLPRLPE